MFTFLKRMQLKFSARRSKAIVRYIKLLEKEVSLLNSEFEQRMAVIRTKYSNTQVVQAFFSNYSKELKGLQKITTRVNEIQEQIENLRELNQRLRLEAIEYQAFSDSDDQEDINTSTVQVGSQPIPKAAPVNGHEFSTTRS